MLEYCTPWPDQFVQDYLRLGDWQAGRLGGPAQTAGRPFFWGIFVCDAAGGLSYGDVDRLAARVALRLLDMGLKPRDIVLLQLPNIREFVLVFFALQKIGVIPIMCLPPHRGMELSYFAQLTGAKAHFIPQRYRNFDYVLMAKELQALLPTLQYLVTIGDGSEREVRYLAPWLEDASQ